MAPPSLTIQKIVPTSTIPINTEPPPAVGMMTAFRALAQDAVKLGFYSKTDKLLLFQALNQIENSWTDQSALMFRDAILKAQADFNAETRQVWRKFFKDHESDYQALQHLFLERDPRLLGERQLALAHQFRKRQLFGTAWTLAKFAEHHPKIQSAARPLIEDIEGKRIDKEYLISDLFDQGGSSIALNMLGGFGGLYLTRKVQRLQRHTAWVLSGPLHFLSTKAAMWAVGYSGKIWPKSGLEWGGELFSSYVQASPALFIANRMFRVPVKAPKVKGIKIPPSTPPPIVHPPSFSPPRFLWNGTKFIGKVAGLGFVNIVTQLIPHYTGLKPMTPQGYPKRISRWFFPKIQENRLAVSQLYDARTSYRQWTRTDEYRTSQQETVIKLLKEHEVSLFLTKLNPTLEGEKRKKVLSILFQADAEGKLDKLIRQLILHQKELGKRWPINKIFEHQKIPLQISSSGLIQVSTP